MMRSLEMTKQGVRNLNVLGPKKKNVAPDADLVEAVAAVEVVAPATEPELIPEPDASAAPVSAN
jgi:hypothetical protein